MEVGVKEPVFKGADWPEGILDGSLAKKQEQDKTLVKYFKMVLSEAKGNF